MSEEKRDAELTDVLKILEQRKALKKALSKIPPTSKEEFEKDKRGKVE